MMNRRGFTLIELLIVVLIIGILAAIAIPKFGDARDQSMVSTMESDLRNLSIHQEIYHSTHLTYAANVSDFTELVASEGVTLQINAADGRGWAATASHLGLPTTQCGLFMGTASASDAGPATVANHIICAP